MKMIWILQSDMIDNDRMIEAIKVFNHPIITFKNFDSREEVMEKISSLSEYLCPLVFVRCNLKWAKFFIQHTSLFPGIMGNPLELKPSLYRALVKNKEDLVNPLVDFTTWDFLKEKKNYWFERYQGSFFIKPDSGAKLFTGQVLTEENFDFEYSWLTNHNHISGNQLVMVSDNVFIEEELRCFFIKEKMVAYSSYSWNEKVSTIHQKELLEFAKSNLLSTYPFGFTMDFAWVNGKPKIIEMNSLSCSGLYEIPDMGQFISEIENETMKHFSGFIPI